MLRICNVCDFEAKNNDKLTRHLNKCLIIRKKKRRKESRSKIKIKNKSKNEKRKTKNEKRKTKSYINHAIVFLNLDKS